MKKKYYVSYNLDNGITINDYGYSEIDDPYVVGVIDASGKESISEFYGCHKEDEARDFIDDIIYGDDED